MGGHGLDLSGLGEGQAGFCECSNETLGSIKQNLTILASQELCSIVLLTYLVTGEQESGMVK